MMLNYDFLLNLFINWIGKFVKLFYFLDNLEPDAEMKPEVFL